MEARRSVSFSAQQWRLTRDAIPLAAMELRTHAPLHETHEKLRPQRDHDEQQPHGEFEVHDEEKERRVDQQRVQRHERQQESLSLAVVPEPIRREKTEPLRLVQEVATTGGKTAAHVAALSRAGRCRVLWRWRGHRVDRGSGLLTGKQPKQQPGERPVAPRAPRAKMPRLCSGPHHGIAIGDANAA